jgi:methyl-accepting chemotaxis protein
MLMHLLRRFSIRARMIGAIAIVLLLLSAVGGAGLLGMHRVESIGEKFAATTFKHVTQLSELRMAMGNIRRYEKDIVINQDKPAEVASYKAKWQTALADARRLAQTLTGEHDDEGTAAAKQIDKHLATYGEHASRVVAQVEAAAYDTPAAASQALRGAREAVHEAETHLIALGTHLQEEADAAGQARTEHAHEAFVMFGIVLALAVVTVVPATLANMVSITRPIAEATSLAGRIRDGARTASGAAEGRDETATLLRSLDEMQRSLGRIVGQVRQASDSIQVASGEVASGSTDLSQRTEEAASSLQQTASSMEQLTGTVRQSAESAATANQLAGSAAQVAQRGGEVVARVVATMDEINASSRRIADIIGVIDGIAFQTNILALNAAVEAARAGEQGRGFAVVAGEVRSLAQRSAEAAKEIKSLIGTSVDKVDTGSKLVGDAGRTMHEIVASVQRVSDIIGEITAAAAEQSAGIGQVNTAVTQLDQMTQQNAALVEQSAAAAESLREQAVTLAGVVSTFRVSSAAPVPTPAPLPVLHDMPAPAEAATPARQAIERARRVTAPAKPATPRTASAAPSAPAADEGDWETF